MTLDYIGIGIIIVSIIAIIVLLSRKFPTLAAIDTARLPRHQQDKVKQELIEDRLKRKFSALSLKKVLDTKNNEDKSVSIVEKFRTFVRGLEQKYQQKIEQLEPTEQKSENRKKIIVLEEAKKSMDAGQYKEAESKYIEAIGLDPKYVEAYEGLAEVYVLLRDYIHAKYTYKFIQKQNASDDVAYDHLGQIALQEGKYEEAEKDYLKSLSLNNQVAGYHVDLGGVYTAMGDYKKALHSYEEAITLEPNNPRFLDCAIGAALVLKNKEIAKKYFDKLKAVNPENEKLKELEDSIDKL